MVNIQAQVGGTWQTVQMVNNIGGIVTQAMQQVSNQYPNSRIRAVTQSGSVVDIL